MTGSEKKRAGIAAGAGLAGLAAIGATYYFSTGSEEDAPAAIGTEVEQTDRAAEGFAPGVREAASAGASEGRLCAPRILAGDGCAQTEALAAQVPGLFRSDAMPSRPVSLVPGDGEGEEAVADCQRYAELRREGWGAATTAEMSREAQLAEICGLVLMAGRAREAEREAPPPGAGLLDRIPNDALPSLGEASFGPDAAVSVVGRTPLVWRVEGPALRGEFEHIGTADFDGDEVAEYLLSWRLEAVGGTLRGTGYGLSEFEPLSFRTVDPFSG